MFRFEKAEHELGAILRVTQVIMNIILPSKNNRNRDFFFSPWARTTLMYLLWLPSCSDRDPRSSENIYF